MEDFRASEFSKTFSTSLWEVEKVIDLGQSWGQALIQRPFAFWQKTEDSICSEKHNTSCVWNCIQYIALVQYSVITAILLPSIPTEECNIMAYMWVRNSYNKWVGSQLLHIHSATLFLESAGAQTPPAFLKVKVRLFLSVLVRLKHLLTRQCDWAGTWLGHLELQRSEQHSR